MNSVPFRIVESCQAFLVSGMFGSGSSETVPVTCSKIKNNKGGALTAISPYKPTTVRGRHSSLPLNAIVRLPKPSPRTLW